jgi:hypothetical protein
MALPRWKYRFRYSNIMFIVSGFTIAIVFGSIAELARSSQAERKPSRDSRMCDLTGSWVMTNASREVLPDGLRKASAKILLKPEWEFRRFRDAWLILCPRAP